MKYDLRKIATITLAVGIVLFILFLLIWYGFEDDAAAEPIPTIGPPREENTFHPLSVWIDDEEGDIGEPAIHIVPSALEPEIERIEPEKEPKVYAADAEIWGTAAEVMAKLLYGEDGHGEPIKQAAVYWVIMNRVDNNEAEPTPEAVIAVCTAKGQFYGYRSWNPVTDEHYSLALDVLGRWLAEKDGDENVGRVLPKDYLWFTGDLVRSNWFRNAYIGGDVWDWSLPDPYR